MAFSVMSERKTWFQSLTIVGGNHPISGHQPSIDFVLQCSLFWSGSSPVVLMVEVSLPMLGPPSYSEPCQTSALAAGIM